MENYIGVRGIESPMYIDNGNRDIPIRDFPTGLRAIVEDRCWKVEPSQEINAQKVS